MVLTTIKKWTVHSWKTVFGRTHITLKGAKKSRHNKALEHTGVSCGWKECDAKDTLIAGEAQTPIGESRATLKPIKSFKLGATREANWRPKSTSLTHTHRPSGKLRRRTSAIPQTKPRPKHESRETGFAWGGGGDLSKGSSYVAWRQTPTQTGGTGLGRGSWRVGPAHAPSALPGRFPTPNLRYPQNSARRGSPLQLPAGPRPAGQGSRAPARAAKVPPPPGWGDQSERRGTATLPDLLPPSTIREAAPPGPPPSRPLFT